jgi:hypothetical protein
LWNPGLSTREEVDIMSPTIRSQARLASVALAAGLAFTAFGANDAGAQGGSFHIDELTCTTTPFGVVFDIGGVGNTNICVEGSADVDLNCACVGGGGNCPTDAKKQVLTATLTSSEAVEPRNGQATGTATLDFAPTNGLCTSGDPALTCPSGQKSTLVSWEIPTGGAVFTVCTTEEAAGDPCTCVGAPTAGELPETITCGPTSDIVFAGKRGNCAALFE